MFFVTVGKVGQGKNAGQAGVREGAKNRIEPTDWAEPFWAVFFYCSGTGSKNAASG